MLNITYNLMLARQN